MVYWKSKLLSLLVGSAFLAGSVLGVREECGTVVTDDEIAETNRILAKVFANVKRQTGSIQKHQYGVYFNIIAANMTEAGGWVPQKQIDDQMTMLNSRYEGTGMSFTLLNVTRVLSRYWHETVDAGLRQTDDMYKLFHKGGSQHLNVYSVGFYDAGLNGYSMLPASYASQPFRDGVVLLYATLPGGSSTERQGGTLVHEAGHWLGLRHTFQGGCTGVGDGVDDTPPVAEANRGCPIGIDTCKGDSLPDPIHNFMDYTDESCRTEFSPGQIDLMQRSVIAFRNNPNV